MLFRPTSRIYVAFTPDYQGHMPLSSTACSGHQVICTICHDPNDVYRDVLTPH